jgi:hypothetical protein
MQEEYARSANPERIVGQKAIGRYRGSTPRMKSSVLRWASSSLNWRGGVLMK